MTRFFLALIAVVSVLAVVPYAGEAQKATPKKDALPKSNQVYVKIILAHRPGEPTTRTDQPSSPGSRSSSRNAGRPNSPPRPRGCLLLIRGEAQVWDGAVDGKQCGCPTAGRIVERADGRIKVLVDGWGPGYTKVTVSLKDEPGSREIAAVERIKMEEGLPYVAVLIGPPPEKPAAPADGKK